MNKLLITGFAPFGGESINPSWEAVKALPDSVGDWLLEKREICVEYENSAAQVLTLAKEMKPKVILCVGQAGGRGDVTPEVIGINLREASIADNAGVFHQGEPIDPEGPDGCFATVPVREMVRAIRDKGIPARLSYSAGAFVCNDVLYSLLRAFRGSDAMVGFLHVPYLPQQGSPSLPLEQITQALTAAIEAIGQ